MASSFMSILVDEGQVDAMVRRVENLLSPLSLQAFLEFTVGPYLQDRAEHRFASEGDDVSGKWAPLTQATIEIRKAHGFPAGPINVRTGRLEEFITNSPIRPWFGAESASITYPSSRPMGNLRKELLGAQQGEGSAPPRPVLGLGEVDLQFTVSALEGMIRGDII